MTGRIVITAVLTLVPLAVHAQTCTGSASFAGHLLQTGVDMSSSASAQSVTTGLSAGTERGPFASVGFGRAHDRKLDDDASVFTASAGASWSLRMQPSLQLCPVLAALMLHDVNLPNGRWLSSQTYGFGASIGAALVPAPKFVAVPFASAAFVIQDATIHTQASAPDFGQTLSLDDTYGIVSLGVGLVVGNSLTLRPSTSFSIAHGTTARLYGLRVAISFGHLPQHAPVVQEGGSLVNVWIDPRAKLYYCADSKWYGNTAEGSFTSEHDAIAAGYEPELRKSCEARDTGSVKPPGFQHR